ncbi:phosphomannomutase/phosphoglucomutase [Aliiroseovarius sp. 2305UL8-7]|uniref:phosphomannomutase/phosphoglucomutase n=1 Tax=Aliiroseovarius conchicola TaxID=3121637 RepID=UPI003528A270
MDVRICPSGFREYDVRWRYPEDIDLEGLYRVGLGFGTLLQNRGNGLEIVLGHDYRSYSADAKDALAGGLTAAGLWVSDIGMVLSPAAYFAQYHLGINNVAMVTASHNPNGWTGVKFGCDFSSTLGPEDVAELKHIVMTQAFKPRSGGGITRVSGLKKAYIDDLVTGVSIARPLRVVCATGNGTAGAFVPEILRRAGVEVIERHCNLDHAFPHYNPNPENLEMLRDMGEVVREHSADLGLGFDGDGDRIGIVDENGEEIFSDRLGLLLARDLAPRFLGARLLVDVKSTGLYGTDPVLAKNDVHVSYCKTGHSHMKQALRQSGAFAAFEKSGHFYFAPPLGRGYDCAPAVALRLCELMDRRKSDSVSQLAADLPQCWTSPTLSPFCPDDQKYKVVEKLTSRLEQMCRNSEPIAHREIVQILTADGARVQFADGDWALVRASSNTPNLVVVCESQHSHADLAALFNAFDTVLRSTCDFGAYDQLID